MLMVAKRRAACWRLGTICKVKATRTGNSDSKRDEEGAAAKGWQPGSGHPKRHMGDRCASRQVRMLAKAFSPLYLWY